MNTHVTSWAEAVVVEEEVVVALSYYSGEVVVAIADGIKMKSVTR